MKQMSKFKNIIKRLITTAICSACIVTSVVSTIPVAKADSSAILGTNAALGSPVLNKGFVMEDWNKWEMEVWGIYLSNFCQPLIDTYETAFKSGGGGSNGAGYQALCFGSGSDPANNEVIKQLCDDAIVYQKTVTKNIYVTYTHVEYDGNTRKPVTFTDANTMSGEPRLATFKDLFFKAGAKADTTSNASIKLETCTNKFENNYTWVAHVKDCYVPTFWIKDDSGKYIKILDYMDSWDLQLSNLLISSVRTGSNKQAFEDKFKELVNGENTIVLDAFGNITTSDKLMVIPAVINPNLTKEKQINLLNSWVFNAYASTYNDEQLIKDLKQDKEKYDLLFIDKLDISVMGGLPAFTHSKNLSGVALMYYDMDTVMTYDCNGGVVHYGQSLKNFFDTDITSNRNNYQLKIEVAGLNESFYKFFDVSDYAEHALATSLLSNEVNEDNNKVKPEMLHTIVQPDGTEVPLINFDNSIIVAPQLNLGEDAESIRMFYNYIYEVYKGEHGESAKKALELNLGTNSTFDEMMTEFSNLWSDFIKKYPEYKNKSWNTQWLDLGDNETVNEDGNRLCKVYTVSNQMKSIGQIMRLSDGAEFNTYCSFIYATYLDWYNIGQSNIIGASDKDSSDFNPDIFNGESDITNYPIEEKIDSQTKEEREEEILNLGYLMLSPEDGREYRKELIYNGFEDFIYEQYNRIVYGGADSMYSGTASKSDSGFLAIETYDDNVFTSWFLDSYVDTAIILIMAVTLAIIIIGLLKKKKISWYFLNLVLAINIILIIPSSGEIVPYVTSSFVQNIFSSKMTYWAVSEGITNNKLEAEYSEDDAAVLTAVKYLNVVYTDRSLMFKQDISQKLTQKTEGIYSDIQNIRSARWLLPMLMQQFTGDNQTSDYLYVKLSNVWDDMSNLYWYYDPQDAVAVTTQTATSSQNESATSSSGDGTKDSNSYDELTDLFEDFKEIENNDTNRENNYNYRCYSYSTDANQDQVHLYAYVLDKDVALPSRDEYGEFKESYKNADSWQSYIDENKDDLNLKEAFSTLSDGGFDSTADEYIRTSRASIHDDYTYLKITENPCYYFFFVVKDTFDSSDAIGRIIGRLQGTVEKDELGNEVRGSFMHATITDRYDLDMIEGRTAEVKYAPYVRDILDLENMFTNTIPYMYQLQLVTGGFDGKSGVLGEDTIEDLQYYEGQLQSWMYRCNWATKLMENPDFSRATKVKDKDGNWYPVANPMMPEFYPDERPMVFSEAQMHAYGLDESDLSLVELKCVEVNKDTCEKWTLLINYAGTGGLTKEVLYRQMATDAAMIFNEQFSTSGILNSKYKLYPTSIDLRYLSFDSVMKMLMINVSKNTNYVYGDTMQTLIAESDMFTAVLLLVDAIVCASIIPFLREFLLALIFYLGFFSILMSLTSDGKHKANIACGQLISNVIFMAYTLVYYAAFGLLMALSSSDDVLTVNNVRAEPGNPVILLILILVLSIAYIYILFKHIKFCALNYKDMGSEVYSMIAHQAADKLSDGLANISSGLANWASGSDSDSGFSGTGNTNSIKGTGTKSSVTQDVNIKSTSKSTLTVENSDKTENDIEDLVQNNYQSGEDIDYIETTTSADIDNQIEIGKDNIY